jgi:hypothetical protein
VQAAGCSALASFACDEVRSLPPTASWWCQHMMMSAHADVSQQMMISPMSGPAMSYCCHRSLAGLLT